MHLIIPYAASHAFNGPEVWGGLQLPHLQTLLGQLQRQQIWQDPERTPLHLPHERLQAQALGWVSDATALPWAAWHQAQQSQPRDQAQAWMTPCHWQVGMDQVVMADPAHLHLSDEESQQLLQAMQPFLIEDGLQVTWHSALLWHAQGALLAELSCASLDRVIGQNVKAWMPDSPTARPLQRLQSEMQMLLYNHPVNNARDARRQIAVNSFWLHGAGSLPVGTQPKVHPVTVPEGLRSAALHGDVQAWRQAWQQLDTTTVADALAHLQATGQVTLSLCSEHAAHTYTAAPAAWHQRITRLFNKTTPAAALAALITP
ncbi:hypothetical protein [Limnohabitans sp. T6-20]|uniref:hypothetical protein n=1 Tax=Limnohabitans sp. T6-20 TaxID=1100725 RepID=UPI000D39407A|nr:hypothetical protein [Limnohabitans sp. T6-20]PUE08349.1 hypothetical protein B9Z33_14220 [Limnohabitans sp. T6-20]